MKKPSPFLPWLYVALCSCAIFLTVPVARKIQRFVSDRWGRPAFGYFVLVSISLGALILLYFLIFRLKIRSFSNYAWLAIVTSLYIYFTLKLWKKPEEAVHFLEYGLLGYFLFLALSHHVRDKTIYFSATLIGLFVGNLDEILQWITPERFWDFRDVGLNVLSVGLFQLAIWKVVRPRFIGGRIKPKYLRILTGLFAACAILLGLCASNTPDRVGRYTELAHWLSFLRKEEPMSEFGYKIKDPEIGLFYSRFPEKKLKQVDREKGSEYGKILSQFSNTDYEQFLRTYSPLTNPFLHEARVHIFRRDTHFEKGKAGSGLNEKKDSFFVAYKENLILQKYFSNTLLNSFYRWDEEKTQQALGLIDRSLPYESPVSAGLFTSFSERNMWTVIIITVVILAATNLIFRRRG